MSLRMQGEIKVLQEQLKDAVDLIERVAASALKLTDRIEALESGKKPKSNSKPAETVKAEDVFGKQDAAHG